MSNYETQFIVGQSSLVLFKMALSKTNELFLPAPAKKFSRAEATECNSQIIIDLS